MKRSEPIWRWIGALGIAGWLALGCRQNPPPPPPASVASAPAPAPVVAQPTVATPPAPKPAPEEDEGPVHHLSHAQVGLPKSRLLIGTNDLTAELCMTIPQVATGLMHRTGIKPEESMLFVFGTKQRRSFYMKNVTFPIAAAYIDGDGVIQEIVQLKAMDKTPVPSKSESIQYVLETAPDWFERHGVGPGMLIVTDRGPMSEKLAPFTRVQ